MTAPLTNPARSSLRGIACPASSHIGRAGTSYLLDCAPVASRAGAAFPLFGLRLSGAILSAATNHNARRGSGRAGDLHHDLRTKSAKLYRRNRAALNLSGILPDRAANDGRAQMPVLLAGHCQRRTAQTTALCFSLQTSAASVAAFAGGC